MKQYHELMQQIMEHGEDIPNRTGVDTRTIFGAQMRFNLQEGFPAVTTKKLAWKACVGELLWFLEGSTDERRLAEITFGKPRDELRDKKTIWTANAEDNAKKVECTLEEHSNLGPIYGSQWRDFTTNGWDYKGVDQIKGIVHQLKNQPDSRRIILSAWNPGDIDYMALPPCHVLSQFRVINGKLYCQLYQRSADLFLGVPFNIASYSLLMHMLAKIVGLEVGDFVWTGGDCHIYHSHFDAVKEQLNRTPGELPEVELPELTCLEHILNSKVDDYKLLGYEHQGFIKADMVV